jgi:ribonuclease BN (tRNA processing enzyme)
MPLKCKSLSLCKEIGYLPVGEQGDPGKMMRLMVLGAGTAIPMPGHSPAGHLVLIDEQPLLFDLGPGTISRLAAAGVDYRILEELFLTHLHSDHTLDLATLLQIYDSTPGWVRNRPLRLNGCKGTRDFYDRLMAAYPGITPSTYSLEIRELGAERLEGPGWVVESALTGHTPASLGYRLEAEGKSIVFSGDAASGEALLDLARQADIFVCECSFPGDAPTADHLNAVQAGRLAAEAGVKSLLLVHLYPPAYQVDLLSQIGRNYRGPVEIAVDGLSIDL